MQQGGMGGWVVGGEVVAVSMHAWGCLDRLFCLW